MAAPAGAPPATDLADTPPATGPAGASLAASLVTALLGQPLTFGRDGDMRPYTTELVLRADGGIAGYDHPNEAGWRIGPDGGLALHDASGRITTCFDEVLENSSLRIALRGAARTTGAQRVDHVISGRGGPPIRRELLAEIFSWQDPFLAAQSKYVDPGYPHSSIRTAPELVEAVLRALRPTFWLEIGSMLGGSAILTAELVKRVGLRCGVVAIDPFCGDVNMWAWEHEHRRDGKWLFLRLEDGAPTIYRRFLANVMAAGHHDVILPIATTSTVGMKLLARLHAARRIAELPSVIYLDSAHEPDETLLELRNAWELLPPGGLLMGDDWGWEAVRADVSRFALTITPNPATATTLPGCLPGMSLSGNVLLYKGQWALAK